MNKGVLIFAQNSEKLDYALMSIISGGLAKKNLNVSVSLATDNQTIEWMKESNIYDLAKNVFEYIIEIEVDKSQNARKLKDGNSNDLVPFKNFSRSIAWEVTPYERTLLIDSDFLIFSDNLNQYWDVDCDVMIAKSMLDLADKDRSGYHDRYISDTGSHLYWATTVMFTKNQYSKIFFDTVQTIRDNYRTFSEIYRFDYRIYRNDISFSIAKHILDGFTTNLENSLPPINTTYDCDILESVNSDGRLIFLISQNGNFYSAMSLKNVDVHVMNKQSIIRHKDQLLELI